MDDIALVGDDEELVVTPCVFRCIFLSQWSKLFFAGLVREQPPYSTPLKSRVGRRAVGVSGGIQGQLDSMWLETMT